MTHIQYIQCTIASLIGMVIHVLVKFQALKTDFDKSNGIYTFSRFLKDDWLALSIDVTTCVGIIYAFDEWAGFTPWIISKIKTIFVFVGGFSSWIMMTLFSKAKDKFRAFVDQQTGPAENKTVIGK